MICLLYYRSGAPPQTGCMDLSSGPRATNSSINEVQDFSMPFKNKPVQNVPQTQTPTPTPPPKSKLDDMLNKLMQKKNCVRTSRVSSLDHLLIFLNLICIYSIERRTYV